MRLADNKLRAVIYSKLHSRSTIASAKRCTLLENRPEAHSHRVAKTSRPRLSADGDLDSVYIGTMYKIYVYYCATAMSFVVLIDATALAEQRGLLDAR